MPEAPDRDYVEASLLECWKSQLHLGLDAERVIEEIETGYRIGIPILELVSSTMDVIKRLHAERGGKRETSFGHTITQHRDVFRYILHLFSYRRVIYDLSNPSRTVVSTIKILPEVRGTIFDRYINLVSHIEEEDYAKTERIEWLGSQASLAALLITLKKNRWIPDYKPYSLIKRAFTKSDTIDQIIRSKDKDVESRYKQIPRKNFVFFEGIKPNAENKP